MIRAMRYLSEKRTIDFDFLQWFDRWQRPAGFRGFSKVAGNSENSRRENHHSPRGTCPDSGTRAGAGHPGWMHKRTEKVVDLKIRIPPATAFYPRIAEYSAATLNNKGNN